jgi:hypothetical protein
MVGHGRDSYQCANHSVSWLEFRLCRSRGAAVSRTGLMSLSSVVSFTVGNSGRIARDLSLRHPSQVMGMGWGCGTRSGEQNPDRVANRVYAVHLVGRNRAGRAQ